MKERQSVSPFLKKKNSVWPKAYSWNLFRETLFLFRLPSFLHSFCLQVGRVALNSAPGSPAERFLSFSLQVVVNLHDNHLAPFRLWLLPVPLTSSAIPLEYLDLVVGKQAGNALKTGGGASQGLNRRRV